MNFDLLEERIGKELLGWDYEGNVWYDNGEHVGHFYPASELEDAFLVLNELCKRYDWKAVIETNKNYSEVSFKTVTGTNTGFFGQSKKLPEAVCLVVIDVLDDQEYGINN